MKVLETDVAVLGAGTAGLSAYKAAIKAGKRALLIEGGPYGTTCARIGCMPSKLLIAAAEAAHAAQNGAAFGVHLTGKIRINGHEVMARIKSERDRFVGFVLESIENIPAQDKLRGYAKFVGPTTLEVDKHTRVKASSVVIATGSSANIPSNFKALGDRVITNEELFYWDDLPERVAVFGPGVIGLEIGQALARLGVTVRIFGMRGSLAGISDPKVLRSAKKIFQQAFYLDPDARVLETSRVGDEIEIRYVRLDNSECVERFDCVLAATGRRPNLGALDLKAAGIEVDDKQMPEFNRLTMQIGKLPVFIAGDVNNDAPLLHEAADEGHIAGMNAARYPDVIPGHRTVPLAIVFTEPQIAMVGQGPDSLPKGSFVTGELDFSGQGRSRVMLKNEGLLHIYADIKTRRFQGAQMIGPSAEHIAHLLAWSVQQEMTIDQMLQMPFYHPVIEEGLRTALRHAAVELNAATEVSAAVGS